RGKARFSQVDLVDLISDEERDTGTRELIVRHRIPHVALQPVRGVGPDLAYDISFGIDGADPGAKLAPEAVGFDLVGNVKPPAVDAELDPLAANVPEESAYFGAVDIQLREGGQAPPGTVIGSLAVGVCV